MHTREVPHSQTKRRRRKEKQKERKKETLEHVLTLRPSASTCASSARISASAKRRAIPRILVSNSCAPHTRHHRQRRGGCWAHPGLRRLPRSRSQRFLELVHAACPPNVTVLAGSAGMCRAERTRVCMPHGTCKQNATTCICTEGGPGKAPSDESVVVGVEPFNLLLLLLLPPRVHLRGLVLFLFLFLPDPRDAAPIDVFGRRRGLRTLVHDEIVYSGFCRNLVVPCSVSVLGIIMHSQYRRSPGCVQSPAPWLAVAASPLGAPLSRAVFPTRSASIRTPEQTVATSTIGQRW
eukprot:359815-Rhodomonas_salina.2